MRLIHTKILMLVDSCSPNMSMNGVVMHNIANYIDKSNYIDIISIRQSKNDVKNFRTSEITYVETIFYKINSIRKSIHITNSKIIKIILVLELHFIRIISLMERMFSPIGINVVTKYRIKKCLTKLLNKKQYDYILCNAKPFENMDAILTFCSHNKLSGTQLIAYQTDDFVTASDERYIPRFIEKWHKKNRKKRLNEYLKIFNRYYMLSSVYLKESIFDDTHNLIRTIGLPLLQDRTQIMCTNKKGYNNIFNLLFAGSLIKAYRPPNDAIKLLLKVSQKLGIVLHIYHKGDCENEINKLNNAENVIINHGLVNTKTAYQAMSNADFLISISNIAGDQISGKTFEYISTGKPIIHFYYNPNDMNKNVLKSYRLALCIQLLHREEDLSVAQIVNFINKNAGKFVNYSEILDCYHDYSIDAVVNELFNACSRPA